MLQGFPGRIPPSCSRGAETPTVVPSPSGFQITAVSKKIQSLEIVWVYTASLPHQSKNISFSISECSRDPLAFLELKSSRNKQLQWKQQDSYCLSGEFQWLLALLMVVGARGAKWNGCLSWSLLRSLSFQKDDENWVRIQKKSYRKCFRV